MCIQSDDEYVYCMNNHKQEGKARGHSWRRQPVSHFGALCGDLDAGQPECVCWPGRNTKGRRQLDNDAGKMPACWAYSDDATGPTADNVAANPHHVQISSLKEDGSVVKVSFHGQNHGGNATDTKTGTLRIGNYNSFLQNAEGCRAIGPVKYRVYVRCHGCVTHKLEFHVKDGARFTRQLTIPNLADDIYTQYTYEAWFKSPLTGKARREIFGGGYKGFTLVNENAVPCLHVAGRGGTKAGGYQVHVGSTKQFGSVCFDANTWYHVAVTRNSEGVTVYVNGRDVTVTGENKPTANKLLHSFGGGFADGGQIFNARIWNHARTRQELYSNAFVTTEDAMPDRMGLKHWWPLVDNTKDLISQSVMEVPDDGTIAYMPIYCSDLEKSGMRGC